MGAITSISGNAHLVKKVYFPREILTISSVLSNFVNFCLALPVLFGLLAVFRIPLTICVLYLPLVMLIQLLFTLGVSLLLATLNVFYRDTSVIMEVLIQAWFFLTPVFYPIDLLPATAQVLGATLPLRRLLYILNPMASIIASYRSILYGFTNGGPPAAPAWDFLLRTAVTSAAALVVGYLIFARSSSRFAEEV